MNWRVPIIALAGSAVGGIAGATVAAYRNRPMETPLLVGASIGAILGSIFAGHDASASSKKPVTGGSRSIQVSPGGNTGISLGVGQELTLNVAGKATLATSDTPGVLAASAVGPNDISGTYTAMAPGSALASLQWTDLQGQTQTSTINVVVS